MKPRESLLLVVAAATLVWSSTSVYDTYSAIRQEKITTTTSLAAEERFKAMTARAAELSTHLPKNVAFDSAPSPSKILGQARTAGVNVRHISSDRGGLHVEMNGSLPAVLAMLDEHAQAVTIAPARTEAVVDADILFGSPRAQSPGEDIDDLERVIARIDSSSRAPADQKALASLFRTDGPVPTMPPSRNLQPSSPPHQPGDYVFAPAASDNPQLRYLGTISGGHRGLCGVFQDARGLVISAKAGEEVASWKIVKIEAEAATLTRGGGDAIPIRVERQRFN